MENASLPLVTPGELMAQITPSATSLATIKKGRADIGDILDGKDNRLLLIVGPCSVHDPDGVIDYATRLNDLRLKTQDRLMIVMRLYFEKPRSVLGWKGLVMDPDMDDTCDIAKGLKVARNLLNKITSMGLACGMEMLDPIIYNYLGDMLSWAAIGARTSESQIHRQAASGMEIPVGFKNSTDGTIDSAVSAIKSSSHSHCYPGIDTSGRVCFKRTSGNPHGHLILRGGRHGSNYDPHFCARTYDALRNENLPESVIVDCSHMNSRKVHDNQLGVWKEVLKRRHSGEENLKGLMVESYLHEGNQSLTEKGKLKYGVSVTDPCVGWEKTVELIDWTCDLLKDSFL
ncbi:3-deoxy-7-phosphoheptulonate synthase [Chitinispirillales bacterium ANBcel5]|uniref:3-deoxy-7-phosphoheptulonate synthase n=1 Tax=Cellulosispirillum alkaliphilum TaxID=3039283 RepID=UPI002A541B47|nr:3-deoxy-7-phosphoheptulonate synthase [Chitinispirillales bacterium ANBcel5]